MNDAFAQYQALYSQYRWLVPTRFNIAEACCRRWAENAAEARRIAVFAEEADGARDIWTFERLYQTANRLSHGLLRMGLQRGDRVAVILPQRGEALAAQFAIQQAGAVHVPLSPQLAPDALEARLRDSEAHIAIVDASSRITLATILHRCPALQQIIGIGFADEHTLAWRSLLARQEDRFTPVDTAATDPALLLYTAGTTGPPRGALHAHAALIGALPGFVAGQDWFPQGGDSLWSAFDWASPGGLLGGVLPTLYFGRPLLAAQGRITPARTLELLGRYRIRCAVLSPSLLAGLMQADIPLGAPLALRSIMCTGDPLDPAVNAWCARVLGVQPNEMFGQAETGFVLGNSRHKWPVRPGSLGLPIPGHRVEVIDEHGAPAATGEIGELAVHRLDPAGEPDPAMFLRYWGQDENATPAAWVRTGDLARRDADGYLWHEGRAEDVFRADGHRIGPGNIENWLRHHPAVAAAAIVPKPDAAHGAIVKAYVVLAPTYVGQAQSYLVEALQNHARERLAPYENPQEIEFVDTLPTSATGAIQRGVLRQRERDRAARRSRGVR
ncbi:AMP-binding protein [Verticiella sediminum]|uniref:AMP-binding protein n=1 Tax=Verticiella sediminum TaxID=1247510 RepID=A0A556A977_9BURK|nr:AMP-binding protein [Verticiella sediminum]TSH89430.1 AMP-binding protein [Verticiella sediminum]